MANSQGLCGYTGSTIVCKAATRDPTQRIVITGMGVVSCFGNDVNTFYDRCLSMAQRKTSTQPTPLLRCCARLDLMASPGAACWRERAESASLTASMPPNSLPNLQPRSGTLAQKGAPDSRLSSELSHHVV